MAWKVQADPYQFDSALAWFRDRLPVNDEEYKHLEVEARRKSFHVAGVASADMVTDVWKALDQAIADGTTLEDFKKAIGTQLTQAWGGSNPARVETIFRTNLQLAYSAGRQSEMADPDIAEERPYRRFIATLDGRTTQVCRHLHNTVLAADDPYWLSRQPPLHFNCVDGATIVEGRALGALRTWYSGQIVELETATGHKLTVTPNHPVLTPSGFKPAGSLKQGDYVLSRPLHVEPSVDVPEDEQHNPAAIEKVFGALGLVGSNGRGKLGPLDLHGDALSTDGDVDVVGAVALLLAHTKTSGSETGGERIFVEASLGNALEECLGAQNPFIEGVHPPGRGGPRGTELPLDGGSILPYAGPLDPLLLGRASKSCASRPQSSHNRLGRVADLFGNSSDGHSGQVIAENLGVVHAHDGAPRGARFGSNRGAISGGQSSPPEQMGLAEGPELHAPSDKLSSERDEGDAAFIGELVQSLPGEVAADQIVKVERREFAGHVFDLETVGGWYVAGGIYISNCRSAIVTLTPEQAEELGVTDALPKVDADEGFGNPLVEWNPDLGKYPAPIADQLEEFFKHLQPLDGLDPMPSASSMAPPVVTEIKTRRDLSVPAPRKPKDLPLDAISILDEKVEGPKGSNDGGMYRGKDGKLRYVKFYKDPGQAYGEHIANQIYKGLGIAAPESLVFEYQGNLAFASEIVPGVQTLGEVGLTKELARKVSDGFMADVLTANWDVVGLSNDNIVVDAKGRLIRIDNGGSFLMRAKAGRKSVNLLNQVTEAEGFFNPGRNASYAKVMAKAGYSAVEDFAAEAKAQAAAIEKLRDRSGGWENFVAKAAPKLNATDRATIVGMLDARTTLLKDILEVKTWDNEGPAGAKVRNALERLGSDRTARQDAWKIAYEKSGSKPRSASAISSSVLSWTKEGRLGAAHREIYKVAEGAMGGATPANLSPEKQLLLDSLRDAAPPEKRRARWEEFFKREGIKATVPNTLNVFRGFKSSDIDVIDTVVTAWKDEAATHVHVVTDPVASWSFNRESGRKFAGDYGVLFNWRACEFKNVLADQIADDGSFITNYLGEHEVIAGPGAGKLLLPKEDQVVVAYGKEYTYSQRAELFQAMAKRGRKP